MTYFPQLEQEQSEPQLPITQVSIGCGSKWGKRKSIQLEAPEHPHSPFMMMVLVVLVVVVRSWSVEM
jgi:hypothetical protein